MFSCLQKSEVISKLEYCQEEHEAAKQFLLSKQQQLESTHRAEVEEMRTAMETLTTNLASYQVTVIYQSFVIDNPEIIYIILSLSDKV